MRKLTTIGLFGGKTKNPVVFVSPFLGGQETEMMNLLKTLRIK